MTFTGLAHQTAPIRFAVSEWPSHWRPFLLKHVTAINRETLPENTDPDYTFRYIDIGSVDSVGRVVESEELAFGEAPSRARRVVRSGDSLVSTVRTYLKAIAQVPEPADGYIASTGFAVVSPGELLDPRFLYWWLRGTSFIEEVVARSRGVSYPAVNASDVGEIAVPAPPIEEQREIARYLDDEAKRIDELIAEQEGRQQPLQVEWFRSSLVTSVLPKALPTGWQATRSKFLFEQEFPGIWGDEATGDENDVTCVRVADFDRLRFGVGECETVRNVPRDQRIRRLLRAGDVLLEKSGGTGDKAVGCAVSFDGSGPAVCSNFIAVLRPRPEHNARYLGLLMAACYQAKLNAPFVKQTTGIQNLDSGHYLGQWVNVPPRSEQDAIASRLERELDLVERRLSELRRQVALLREHRQALITAAVTGRLEALRKVA